MTRSGSLPEDRAVPSRSIGYTKPPGATTWAPNTETLPYRGTSAGGGYSMIEDLAQFADALLSHRLLSPDCTKLLVTGKVKARHGARDAYGFEMLETRTPQSLARLRGPRIRPSASFATAWLEHENHRRALAVPPGQQTGSKRRKSASLNYADWTPEVR
jgi:hypothetical protein